MSSNKGAKIAGILGTIIPIVVAAGAAAISTVLQQKSAKEFEGLKNAITELSEKNQ